MQWTILQLQPISQMQYISARLEYALHILYNLWYTGYTRWLVGFQRCNIPRARLCTNAQHMFPSVSLSNSVFCAGMLRNTGAILPSFHSVNAYTIVKTKIYLFSLHIGSHHRLFMLPRRDTGRQYCVP